MFSEDDNPGEKDDDVLSPVLDDDEEIEIDLGDVEDDEPPTLPPEDEPSEEEEDNFESFSEKFQKRLKREQRAKLRERQEKAEKAALAEEYRRQAERLQAELEAERKIRTSAINRTAEVELASIDREIADKRVKYKALRAEFDPDKADEEVDLFNSIAELNQRKRDLQQAQPRAPEQPQAASQPTPQPVQLAPQAQAWIKRNAWYGKAGFAAQTAAAERIDNELANAGYQPDDPEYFNELDRRLNEAVKLPTTKRNDAPSPVQSGRNAASAKGNKVTITAEDKAFLRSLKMDPSDPAVLREYALQKRAQQV